MVKGGAKVVDVLVFKMTYPSITLVVPCTSMLVEILKISQVLVSLLSIKSEIEKWFSS